MTNRLNERSKNKMNMPRFTGEASLYKTGRHYYKAGNLTQTDGIYPAFTISDLLRGGVPVVYYPPSLGVPVLDLPFARYLTESCCSKCGTELVRCNQICERAYGPRKPEFYQCLKDCKTSYDCTRRCNAQRFGGCDALLGY